MTMPTIEMRIINILLKLRMEELELLLGRFPGDRLIRYAMAFKEYVDNPQSETAPPPFEEFT